MSTNRKMKSNWSIYILEYTQPSKRAKKKKKKKAIVISMERPRFIILSEVSQREKEKYEITGESINSHN